MSLPTHDSNPTPPFGTGAYIEPESSNEILDGTLIHTADSHDIPSGQLSSVALPTALLHSMCQDSIANSPSTLSGSSVAWVVQAPRFKSLPVKIFPMKYNPFGQIRADMTDQEIADWSAKQKDDTIEAIRQYPSTEFISAVSGMDSAAVTERKAASAVLKNCKMVSSTFAPQIVSRGPHSATTSCSASHQSFDNTTGNTELGSNSSGSPICRYPTPSVSRWSSSFRNSLASSDPTSQSIVAMLQPLHQPFPTGTQPNFPVAGIHNLQPSNSGSLTYQSARSSPSPTDSNAQGVRPRGVFRPSEMLLEKHGIIPARGKGRVGTNYRGDTSSNSFKSQIRDLADHLNCALWITGIPVSVTISEIFDIIHCGTVFALHLSPPKDDHLKAAAKLVFMTPESAGSFITQARSQEGCYLGGFRVFVKYNRDGYLRRGSTETRVLRIEGPREKMNWGFWKRYFEQVCVFEMDRWRYLPCSDPNTMKMEFQFARVDGQAQTCRQKIITDEELSNQVVVEYGPDSCDPNNLSELNMLKAGY